MSFEGSSRFAGLSFWPSGSILGAAAAIELGLLPLEDTIVPEILGTARCYDDQGRPGHDTIHGGAYVAFLGDLPLGPVVTNLRAGALPAGWTTAGGAVDATPDGVVLRTSTTAASTVTAGDVAAYTRFRARTTVTWLAPGGLVAGEVEIGLQFGATRVSLVKSPTLGLFGRFAGRAVAVAATATHELELVVFEDRAWAFVDGVALGRLDGLVGSANVVQLVVANNTVATAVTARFTDFDLSGHAILDGVLVLDPTVIEAYALAATVPKTTPLRIGLRDFVVFSQFGRADGVAGFRYTRPAGLTLVHGIGAPVIDTIEDPTVID